MISQLSLISLIIFYWLSFSRAATYISSSKFSSSFKTAELCEPMMRSRSKIEAVKICKDDKSCKAITQYENMNFGICKKYSNTDHVGGKYTTEMWIKESLNQLNEMTITEGKSIFIIVHTSMIYCCLTKFHNCFS